MGGINIMNNIFEKNIKALIEYQGELFEQLRNYTDNNDCVEIIKNKRNEDILVYKDGEKDVYFNSRYNALSEAEIWAKNNADDINRPYFIYGLGNGMCVSKLRDCVTDKSLIIIYEPMIDIFYHVIENIDLTELIAKDRTILFVNNINDAIMKKVLNQIISINTLEKAKYVTHPKYDKLDSIDLEEYFDKLHEVNNVIISDEIFFDTNSKRMMNTNALNMEKIREFRTINQYIGKFREEDMAILVGAGPSLSKNIELLKQVKNKALIFATDSAVKKMSQYGIEPDVYMTVDIDKDMLLDNDMIINIPVVMDTTCNIETIKKHRGIKIVTGKNNLLIRDIYSQFGIELDEEATGGSVSCSIFSVLKIWGFKKIVLIGQDFAYTDGKVHAEGIFEKNNPENMKNRKEYVEDDNGNMLLTGYDFKMYLKWFEDAIKEWKTGKVINATEGGARVKGAEVMTLQKVIDTYLAGKKDFDYVSLIKNMPPALSEKQCKETREYMMLKKEKVNEFIEKANEGIKIQSKLKKMLLRKENNSMLVVSLQAKMKAITLYIDKFDELTTLYFYKGELVDSMNTETDENDTKKIIEQSVEWLQNMKIAAEEYRKDIELIMTYF